MRVGVLALQGGFEAHARVLATLGHEPVPVARRGVLAEVQGLVLPGGESGAQLRLMAWLGLDEELTASFRRRIPVLATCAGLILAARRVRDPEQASLGWIDVEVARNGYGRQKQSFVGRSDDGRLELVFIRAPRIRSVGDGVEVLATLGGEAVMVRQGCVTAATFHPELAGAAVHAEVFGDQRRPRRSAER